MIFYPQPFRDDPDTGAKGTTFCTRERRLNFPGENFYMNRAGMLVGNFEKNP